MPVAPRLRDQRQLGQQFQIGLQLDRLAVRGHRRQAAEPRQALPLAREGGDRAAPAASVAGVGFSTIAPAAPSSTASCRSAPRPAARHAQHRRHAQRAQHDRGMPVGAALLGSHAGDPRRIDQRRVGRAQRLGHQDRALRQAGEAAERRLASGCAAAAGRSRALSSARRCAARRVVVAGHGAAWPRPAPRPRPAPPSRPSPARRRCAGGRRAPAATGRASAGRRRAAARSRAGCPPAARRAGRAACPAACAIAAIAASSRASSASHRRRGSCRADHDRRLAAPHTPGRWRSRATGMPTSRARPATAAADGRDAAGRLAAFSPAHGSRPRPGRPARPAPRGRRSPRRAARSCVPMPAPSIISPMIERADTDLPVPHDVDGGAEPLGQRHELGGRAGMQAAPVARWSPTRGTGLPAASAPAIGAGPRTLRPASRCPRSARGAPASRLPRSATQGSATCRCPARGWQRRCICGRPSRRIRRQSASGLRERTLASLTSIGRFTPAITSTPPRPSCEMARLLGVPPNMSVSRTTPSPVSTSSMRWGSRRADSRCRRPGRCRRWQRALRPDHVLHGQAQLLGEPPVGHQDQSDHGVVRSGLLAWIQPLWAPSPSPARRRRRLAQLRRIGQIAFAHQFAVRHAHTPACAGQGPPVAR